MSEAKTTRVLLFGPANEILGGQAVQAQRLVKILGAVPGVEMRFQAINPLFPRGLRWVKRIPFVRTALTMIVYVPEVLVRAWWADILHIFTAGLYSYTMWTIPALIIGKLYGKKLIINYRDGQGDDHLREFRSAVPTLRWGDIIVTNSGFIVDIFAKYGLKAELISNVIDTSGFPFRQRGDKLKPVIMTNRILEPLYNIECILRAFKRVLERYPEATLTIAHVGPSGEHLQAYAKEIGLRNYKFVGKIQPPEMPKLYDAAEIYITTPNRDCNPGSLLECMSSGVPIIATNTGGIPYLVQHEKSALLIELDDDATAAQHIFRLLEEPGLAARLTAEAREAVKGFSVESVRRQWLQVYRDLLGRGPLG